MRTFISNIKKLIKVRIFKKSHLFFRYLVSYLLVLLLPILVMSLLVFNYIFKAFEKEVLNSNINTLNHVKTTMDVKLDELSKIMYQVFYNPEILSYYNNGDPLKGVEIIKLLKNAIYANKYIHELILYTGESNYLLSSTGSYTITNFTDNIYNFSKWNSRLFIDDLNNCTNPYFRAAENATLNSSPKRFITGIFPNNTHTASLVFLIEEDTLLQALRSFRGNTLVIDNNYNIIASTIAGNHTDETGAMLKAHLYSEESHSFIKSDKLTDFTTMKVDNVDYFISYIRSQDSKWTYVNLVPVNEVMGTLKNGKTIFIYCLVMIFVVGSIVILVFTRYNYNPIKQLKQFAENRYGKTITTVNELDAVRYTINSIFESNTQLKEKIRISQPALKDFVLTSFLKGNFKDINDFNKAAKEAGLFFTKSYYQIASILISDTEKYFNNKDDIVPELEKNLPEGLEGYCKDNIEDNKLVMILSTDKENFEIRRHMESIQRYLFDQWDIHCTIGISTSCNNISNIWRAYIEASTALDYRLIMGNNNVIIFNDISVKTNDSSFYSAQAVESLSICIKNANFDKAGQLIDNLVEKIKGNTSLFMARCMCFDIINSLMRSIYDINKSFVLNDNERLDLISLMRFETIEELAETAKAFCFDVCEYIETIRADYKNSLFNDIKAYIDQSCCNLDFSAQMAADHFRMSLSNFGQYFKSHAGVTISEYICNMQIERAKELLRVTDDSIQIIVRKVGHYDSSNFIRKFKQVVGVTPGEYRKFTMPQDHPSKL